MRRIHVLFSLAFALVILWQAAGVFPVFEFTLQSVRKETKTAIKYGVPQEEWLHFSIDSIADQIVWTKPGKEFRYKGTMYDVLHPDCANPSVLVCIADVHESGLFEHLEELVANAGYGSNEKPGPIKQVLKVFGSTYVQPNSFSLYNIVERDWMSHLTRYQHPGSSSHLSDVFHPPC